MLLHYLPFHRAFLPHKRIKSSRTALFIDPPLPLLSSSHDLLQRDHSYLHPHHKHIMAPAAVSEFMHTTTTPSRIDISLQKPSTLTSIEVTAHPDNVDPETKRLRVKEDCAAALRILSSKGYDHFIVSLLFQMLKRKTASSN